MEVLVVATHNAALLDDLHAIIHRALQASETKMEVVVTMSHESPMADNQLLLWRDNRPLSRLSALIQEPTNVSRSSPSPRLVASAGVDSHITTATAASTIDATALMIKQIQKRDRKIKSLTAEVEDWKAQLDAALTRAKLVESEQEQFFEDVQHMKEAYDKLHSSHQKLLWEYLPSRDPDMNAIPRLSQPTVEGDTSVGQYTLSEVLGYGQYAVVYASHDPEDPKELLAVKAIDKEKLMDLVTLHRVNSEIASLRDAAIQHPGILALRDVIHTKRHIYLVTERGGKDLFEFFGPHDEGVPEETIKSLLLRVGLAVQTLHRHNYCHRDLKPENILYRPDHPLPTHTVKLVDFGLCIKATSSKDSMLHDFCGSPGFFAPEILLQDRYDGLKADMWSLGCILLELIVGNERFAAMWMAMYELETLRNHTRFTELVRQSLTATREYCHGSEWKYSVKLRHLLSGLLCEVPAERLSIREMLEHPWFDSESAEEPQGGSPLAKTRSPPRAKFSLPSAFSFSDGALPTAHPDTNVTCRPLSAESSDPVFGSPHVSVLLSALPSSPPRTPVKVCLPSLSPEKPTGSRSPDKSFTKRNPSVATHMPTAMDHDHSSNTGSSSTPHQRSSSRLEETGHI